MTNKSSIELPIIFVEEHALRTIIEIDKKQKNIYALAPRLVAEQLLTAVEVAKELGIPSITVSVEDLNDIYAHD